MKIKKIAALSLLSTSLILTSCYGSTAEDLIDETIVEDTNDVIQNTEDILTDSADNLKNTSAEELTESAKQAGETVTQTAKDTGQKASKSVFSLLQELIDGIIANFTTFKEIAETPTSEFESKDNTIEDAINQLKEDTSSNPVSDRLKRTAEGYEENSDSSGNSESNIGDSSTNTNVSLYEGINNAESTEIISSDSFNKQLLSAVSEYASEPYVYINDNIPYFYESELTTEAFEIYSELDDLGRCGTAYANICSEIMPTEERSSIGSVKPTGWVQNKYEILKDSDNTAGYLYNRCHLIAYSLAGENANSQNLITGTRYMNVEGMEPFEMQVLNYVRATGNHVLYRVTPIFEGENLLASGVLMEAYSVEDLGEGICFCVYCYNVQPGIKIDYSTGENQLD